MHRQTPGSVAAQDPPATARINASGLKGAFYQSEKDVKYGVYRGRRLFGHADGQAAGADVLVLGAGVEPQRPAFPARFYQERHGQMVASEGTSLGE
jgi:hypothetical protein